MPPKESNQLSGKEKNSLRSQKRTSQKESFDLTLLTPSVSNLAKLISSDDPLCKNGQLWKPHKPILPDKDEGGIPFELSAPFSPKGDQPNAISELVANINNDTQTQILLGVTGSGKTFTMAQVIMKTQRPALILAPNKTLAAQLYGEFKSFFPNNAVEYFVSYYDYYQPEAYVPRSDTYIEKESSINEDIDRMRHSATRALFERDDVIIVSSVSCIYGIGSVETYGSMTLALKQGASIEISKLLLKLVDLQYKRQNLNFVRGSFRVRGDLVEIFPSHLESRAWRLSFFGDIIEEIHEIDPLTGKKTAKFDSIKLYANSHYVTPRPTLKQAIVSIETDLQNRLMEFKEYNKLVEAQRLEQRTYYDLELLKTTGTCSGIENYSRYLTGRNPGEPPPTLFEYLPERAILFADESHVSIPQIAAMYRGDFKRKATLAEYGFRLPSCMDNRPLRFEEWNVMRPQTVAVSATPGKWELEQTEGTFVEQIIRPTGLLDPIIIVSPAKNQVDDLLQRIHETIQMGYRILVTVLTKRMAEDLTEYLYENGINVRYMHSDVQTLERIELIQYLRMGQFDVLIGINLLREGLDIPECGLVAILDADKEGFLRSESSLIQTIGRAARNADGRVILYADRMTGSLSRALDETTRRRDKQIRYNELHNITPQTIEKNMRALPKKEVILSDLDLETENEKLVHLTHKERANRLAILKKEMLEAAENLDFERAAELRDRLTHLSNLDLLVGNDIANVPRLTSSTNSAGFSNKKSKKTGFPGK